MFKMYANESKGEKYPPLAEFDFFPAIDCEAGVIAGTPSAQWPVLAGNSAATYFSFYVPQVYPEYLTDANILICPSEADPLLFENPNVPGEPILHVACDQYGVDAAGDVAMGQPGMDESYYYLGWAVDQAENQDCDASGLTGITEPISGQVVALLVHVDVNSTFEAMDGDIDVSSSPIGDMSGYGNGGGETIFRLREGIERFMITDINNPAASAMAQTEIAIMADLVSTNVDQFNHIPGGSNVLFLDGHVQFFRYPGPHLVSRSMALTVGFVG